MLKVLSGLVMGVLALLGLSKFINDNALHDNEKTKEALDVDNAKLTENSVNLQKEEDKRKELLKEEEHEKANNDNVVDFFNNRK